MKKLYTLILLMCFAHLSGFNAAAQDKPEPAPAVFRALELATEETHVAQPEITGGHIHFTSQGTQDTGGFLVEANDVAIDCGTTLKISLTIRHERKQTLATNAREAVAAAEAADAAKA